MRFYINILSTYYPDRDPPYDAYYQQILDQVRLAEELGWECFMFNEHHFLAYGGLIANPAVLLSAAAARTSRIRLGPCIAILTLRHPLQIAEDYAMVDAISGGRLEFGIGSGNTPLDYRILGISQQEGRARLDEAIKLIVKAWTNHAFSTRGDSGDSMRRSPFTQGRCSNRIRRSGWRERPRRRWGGREGRVTTS